MVLDTSAVLAILLDESERRLFGDAIESDAVRLISAASYFEAAIVMESRHGDDGVAALKRLLAEAAVEVVPVTLDHAETARQAYRRYGKGYHPAKLNFGDCFSYALAKIAREPLLFKGTDFVQTDIVAAA